MRKKDKKMNAPLNHTDNVESRLYNQQVVLDIPDDEIWTYRIEGLAAPQVNKQYKHFGLKKFIFVILIVIAVSLSMYFSVRTVQSNTFEYTAKSDGTYEFSSFSNTGFITEVTIDYVTKVVYDENNPDVTTNFSFEKDEAQPISSIRAYTFNCDEKVKKVYISENVSEIDGKAFYSCWALQCIEVDENNPYYCDVDGVLYNKEKTEIICYPCDHDQYLRDKYGYAEEPATDAENFAQYEADVLTYVVPSTVEIIGELCFNYANMSTVYLPEGLKTIETLGFFEIPKLANVYSYKSDDVADTHLDGEEALGEIYLSLPEGLEYIGSDAFSYNQAMTYIYIPSSVTYIGHHAFWDTVYKSDSNLCGITVINTAASEEDFKKVDTGDEWRPQYDFMLFKKSVDINYGAQRKTIN